MKLKHILLFFISMLFVSSPSRAQEETTTTDSIVQKTKYGLRLGIDLAKPARTVFEDGYTGFEILGDFRISNKFYAAAEIGNETKDYDEDNLVGNTKGSYIKIGADYNANNNWFGLNNAIFVGLRYGFSSFSQELESYTIYTTNQDFLPAERIINEQYKGLTGSWVELQLGVKTEVLNNLFISINLQLKRKISESSLDNFDNLYIPGFNATNDFSEFGAGYGYTISYLIPIFKK